MEETTVAATTVAATTVATTTVATTTVATTTVAETTEAQTTEAQTTEVQTTEVQTTEEPTTENLHGKNKEDVDALRTIINEQIEKGSEDISMDLDYPQYLWSDEGRLICVDWGACEVKGTIDFEGEGDGSFSELKSIKLFNTDVSGLSVSNLPSLEEISCSECYQLTELTLMDVPELIMLDIDSTSIRELDLSHCDKMQQFYRKNVEFSNLNLPLYALENLSNWTNEEDREVFCCSKNIYDLMPLWNEFGSGEYYITYDSEHYSNCFEDPDLFEWNERGRLVRVNLSGRLDILAEVPFMCFPFNSSDIEEYAIPFYELREIDLSNNECLTIIAVEGLCSLNTLVFDGCNNLKVIHIHDNNKLSYISDMYSYEQLQSVMIGENPMLSSTIEINSENLTELWLEGLKECRDIYIMGAQITNLDLSGCEKLEHIVLIKNEELETIDIDDCVSLEFLRIEGNKKLESLDVRNSPNLEELRIEECSLSDLDVTKNLNLKVLRIVGNYQYACENEISLIKEIDLKNNSELEELGLDRLELKELDVTKNLKLKHLSCEDNYLNSLNISNNVVLEYLNCYGNDITELNVANNSKLETIYCDDEVNIIE
jgi:hypothetical protein